MPRQLGIDFQLPALVELPNFLAVPRPSELWREPCEEGRDVVDIPNEEALGISVERRVDGLRKVNDDRPRLPQQHVEVRQVAVHYTRTQHLDDLTNQDAVQPTRFYRRKVAVDEARRRLTGFTFDELHHEDALKELERLRYSNASIP